MTPLEEQNVALDEATDAIQKVHDALKKFADRHEAGVPMSDSHRERFARMATMTKQLAATFETLGTSTMPRA